MEAIAHGFSDWSFNTVAPIYPFVICYTAIETGHRNSGFSHQHGDVLWLCKGLPEAISERYPQHEMIAAVDSHTSLGCWK